MRSSKLLDLALQANERRLTCRLYVRQEPHHLMQRTTPCHSFTALPVHARREQKWKGSLAALVICSCA